MTNDLLLPERARLFHIGPPKTASTALQQRAAAHRDELLQHGVRYPRRTLTQRAEVASFIGRSVGWVGTGQSPQGTPSRAPWDAMMREIESDTTRRILFGHEYAAGATDEQARGFVTSIGPRAHVVITLRAYASMLPSIWQEYNKAGNLGSFEAWMRKVVERPRSKAMSEKFFIRHDHGALVRRWARAAGPENVTVVILDPGNYDFVYTAFEQMLGLPSGLLNERSMKVPANRGMTVPEIELLRRLNAIVKPLGIGWSDYERLIAGGAALRLLEARTPPLDEARLQLPDWSIEVVNEDAEAHVADIAASGVRVVGDLRSLAEPAGSGAAGPDDANTTDSVPIEAAAQALAGMFSAATGRGWDFAPPKQASEDAISRFPARTLARELALRTARRARVRRRT